MKRTTQIYCASLLFLTLRFIGFSAAPSLLDAELASIRFEQKLNAQVPLGLEFRDENNKTVHLTDYLGQKPAILVLGYYGCPMLCTLVLNGLTESMEELKWSVGNQYNVINVSIATNETPLLAFAKKASYLKRYGRPGAAAGWHFLTGDAKATKQLADEVGFQYAYDPITRQYAHPSGIIILTPEGKVSKYLFGVTFAPKELFAALEGASSHTIGSRIQELILLCFHYRPVTGKYGALVMIVVRILAAATLVFLAWLIIGLSATDRARRKAEPELVHSPKAGPGV